MSILMLNTDYASPAGMKHACNLWKNPKTCKYEVDYLEHHRTDLIHAFIKVANVKDDKLAPTPHKWAKEMHAFADGWTIQVGIGTEWFDDSSPKWHPSSQYRIKPEPAPIKPNILSFIPIIAIADREVRLLASWSTSDNIFESIPDCTKIIRIEFNPNDQTLVSAEVVTL